MIWNPRIRIHATAYNYGSSNALNDVISRLDSMTTGGNTLESYKCLGTGTVVERDHPQDGINLTYIKIEAEATGTAGDNYNGIDMLGRVIDQRWVDSNNSNADVDRYTYRTERWRL